jgi:tetratricopeptide (TPR) repeat protein
MLRVILARWCATLTVASALAMCVGCPTIAAQDVAEDSLALRNDFGVTFALGRDWTRAESVFVGVLSLAPDDARAYNNLGNLQVLQGRPEVALAFYDRAAEADPTDGGIRLNRALVMLIQGDSAAASAEASAAIREVGGEGEALRLLGVRQRARDKSGDKAETLPYLTEDEVRGLLQIARQDVPVDAVGSNAGADSVLTHEAVEADSAGVPPRAPAGTAADSDVAPSAPPLSAAGASDLVRFLYWKR